MKTLSQQFVQTSEFVQKRFDLVQDDEGQFAVHTFENWKGSDFDRVHRSDDKWFNNESDARAVLLDLRMNTVDFRTL